MPSVSPAQHRWIGWLHSNPDALAHSGMSRAKVDEWLHSDKGSPWKHRDAGGGLTDPTSPALGGIAPSGAIHESTDAGHDPALLITTHREAPGA